jgi:hypothetical protein
VHRGFSEAGRIVMLTIGKLGSSPDQLAYCEQQAIPISQFAGSRPWKQSSARVALAARSRARIEDREMLVVSQKEVGTFRCTRHRAGANGRDVDVFRPRPTKEPSAAGPARLMQLGRCESADSRLALTRHARVPAACPRCRY